jgi:CxxH/CxxC protein (TIGR04129 family)
MLYACEEHIDFVMEDFIDEFEVAPTLELLDSPSKETCNWCQKQAQYALIQEETEDSIIAD